MRGTTNQKLNRELSKLGNHFVSIPLDKIFEICRKHDASPVQEDGTPWSGLLCGNEGRATIELCDAEGRTHKQCLQLNWYRLESGSWEVVTYVL